MSSRPPFLPVPSLVESLRMAAGADLDAFNTAALTLVRVMGSSSEEGSGGVLLDRALAAWCQRHDVPAPMPGELLGLLVQAIAVL